MTASRKLDPKQHTEGNDSQRDLTDWPNSRLSYQVEVIWEDNFTNPQNHPG
jgi:hypothetical protein